MRLLRLLTLAFLPIPSFAQFQAAGSVPLGFNTHYAFADFNLDGRMDYVACAGADGILKVSLGTANGGFTSVPGLAVSTGFAPWGLFPGDFTNDGKMDIAVVGFDGFPNGLARIFRGLGDGTFVPGGARISFANFRDGAAAGDFDEDGNLDVAIHSVNAGGQHIISILRGDGKGELSAGKYPPVAFPVSNDTVFGPAEAADMNGDSRLDLVFPIRQASGSGFGILVAISDGRGSFSTTVAYATPRTAGGEPRLAIGDFNEDRRLDVVAFEDSYGKVALFTNLGNGQLVHQPTSTVDLSALSTQPLFDVAAADFDLDGHADWAIGTQQVGEPPRKEVYLAFGDGNGHFTLSSTPLPYGGIYPYLEVGDFDSDRRPDLMVLEGVAEKFTVLLNTSPRAPRIFAQEIQFPRPADRPLGSGPLTLTAIATSGLPVSYASIGGSCSVTKGVVTLLSLGVCSLVATQAGNRTFAAATPVQQTFFVTRGVQTITFDPLPDVALGAAPFPITATASSGLAVSLVASPSNVCAIDGTLVSVLLAGQCSITASQSGGTLYNPATPVTRTFTVVTVSLAPRIESVANAASYKIASLAPGSYGVLFGSHLGPNPTVRLRDGAGTSRALELIYSGDTQINFIVPGDAPLGQSAVTVTTGAGAAEFAITVARTVPGLFSANGTGAGVAAAQAVIVNNDKSVTTLTVADGAIPVLGGTEIYLVLYGTGIRGHGPDVFASVAGRSVDVLYAGPQGGFPGLDQVNLRIPLSVGGVGSVNVVLSVDGVAANTVTVRFQ